MASDNKQVQIREEMFRALGLEGYDPLDRTLWALICVMSQVSEAFHQVSLHRNADRRFAAVVMLIQRAGRLAYRLRKERPSRGSVEYIHPSVDDELAEALQYLFLAAQTDKPSLQYRAAKMLRMSQGEDDPADDLLLPEEEAEFEAEKTAWEVLSNEALDAFERDLATPAVDDLRQREHPDAAVPDAQDAGGGVGDGADDAGPG